MIDHNRRVRLADELLRRFASALRGAQLYAASHPLVGRNTDAFYETIGLVIGQQRSLTLGVVGGEFVVGDVPLPRSSGTMGDLMRRLQRLGVERIVIDRDVTPDEIATLVSAFAGADGRHGDARRRPGAAAAAPHPGRPHPGRAAGRHVAGRYGGDPRDLQRGLDRRRTAVAAVDGRGPPRPGRGARHGRHAGAGRRAESHGARRAHRAQELRQLHVHAHGERLDPDDGPGARARHRRHAAARVRHRRADARHRQGRARRSRSSTSRRS